MFRNYLVAAWRNAIRDRLHAVINVSGLAIGLAAAMLIALFVRDELSYDQFLPGHDRVFLIGTHLSVPGRPTFWHSRLNSHSAGPLTLEFPEFDAVARLTADRIGLRHGDVEGLEDIYWADPKFLSIVGLPVIAGDAATALDAPDSVVLTRSMARKYFGSDAPLGATLEFSRQNPMRVTAVIEDLPSNTQFDTKILASGRSPLSSLAKEDATPLTPGNNDFSDWGYVRLKPGIDPKTVESRFPDFVARYFAPENAADPKNAGNTTFTLDLVPLAAVHLLPLAGTMTNGGSVEAIVTVSIIAVLIIAIASINFVNLMTARAARRAIEVGVRKALGATQAQLLVQFMSESIAFAIVASVLAVALVELALPAFNAFLDRKIGFAYWQDPRLLAGIVGLVLIVGVGAGLYPALVLSAFRPGTVLKGGRSAGKGGGRLRQILVVLQFATSIGLAIATLIIVRQTEFATSESLGFDKDQVLIVPGAEACGDAFRDRVAALPGVRAVACSQSAPINVWSDGGVTLADGRSFDTDKLPIDFGFFELYGLRPLAGRLFDRAYSADAMPRDKEALSRAPIIINETAVRTYGFASPAAALGQFVTINWRAHEEPAEIVGVVPDFPIGSIRQKITPALFFVDPTTLVQLSVKLDGAHVSSDLAGIDRIWGEAVSDRPIRRFFLDARIEQRYDDIVRQGQIFAGFAVVALVIGCLGLFGLSAFTAERRTKEIGIRKALGASTGDVVKLLIWQFAKPVLVANAIAWPVAWFVMRRWLDGFAYRIPLSWEPFAVAGAAALAIAILTTGFHAVQVARSRPVTALRYE